MHASFHHDQTIWEIRDKGKKGRKIAHKLVGERLLRVVFEPKEKSYILITAYYAAPERYVRK